MTTHELATTLERLRDLFGEDLNKPARGSLTEAATAFRELPDQNLRAFLTTVRRANAPQLAETGAGGGLSAVTAGVVERVRAIRAGTESGGDLLDLSKMTGPQLKEVLREFKQPVSGNKPDLILRVRQLCVRVTEEVARPVLATHVNPPPDPAAVEAGVQLYEHLFNDRKLSIPDVQAGFAPLREYPKPLVEEISRKLGYTPSGSREDVLARLLKNLVGIKMDQHRADRIMTGTSG